MWYVVGLTLNEPEFLLPFSGSEELIRKYRTMPWFQKDLWNEQFKSNIFT